MTQGKRDKDGLTPKQAAFAAATAAGYEPQAAFDAACVAVQSVTEAFTAGQRGTRPGDGRRPTTLQ